MVFLGRLIQAYLRALQLAPDPTAAGAEERPAGGACAEGQAGTGHGNLRLRSHRAPGNCMQGSNPTAGPRLSLGNAEHLGILVQSGTAEHSSIPALRRLVHTSVALSLSNAH